MSTLLEELKDLIADLEGEEIDYALCGGLALAVHGIPRATIDIDVLVAPSDVEDAIGVAHARGFTIDAEPMSFAQGKVQIRRTSKVDRRGGEPISVDFLLVTPPLQEVWDTRQRVQWSEGELWVVSKEGLVDLKRIRSSPQDFADIARLQELDDER